ncbi:MAG: PAS domain S-box protein, partial [Chloroflexota bacterium]|nr:PAS domain S-box protein [Chloroflexota bacterium]
PVAIAGAREFVRLGAEMDAMRRQLQARADELAASEARFRALAEHGSDLVCVLAPDGAALYGSPSYGRILGASIEDLHQAAGSPLAAIHPDDRAHVHAALAACVTEGRPSVTLTCRHRHADGSWRTLECVATNRLADSAVRGVIVTSRDVTARAEAEERLRTSEERLRALITHLPVILFALDADGVFTLSDGAGLASLGVAPGAVVGRSAFDVHADHPAITAGLRRALAGEPTDFIHTISGLTLDARVTPLRDAQGRVMGAIGVSVDVTDRVRAEEALRAEEEALWAEEARYRAVANAAHDAIIAADSAGRIISWNRGAAAIFGYTPGEAIGQPLTLLMPEEYRAAHQRGLERSVRGEALHSLGQTLELQGQRKDGSAFPIELSLSSWETAEGAFYGGIIRDVSARRAMEAALDQERTILRADAERLSGVIAIQQEVALADLDTRVVLPLIAARAQELSGADGAVVELVEGEDMVYHAVTGTLEGYEGTRLPLIGTLTGLCVRTGETLYCADAAIDPRTDPVICRRLGIGSMVVVPLRHGGAVVGALKVSATATHAFDARAVQTLQLMAGVLGAALGQAAAFDALRVSEERLRTVVANAPLILFTIDPAGVYTMSDGAGLAALGREPGAVVGRSVFDVYRDQPALLDDTRRALAGTPVTFPSQVHGAVFDNHLTPLHDAQGRLISVIGVSTNITERARAEAALVENRRELERSNAELQQFAYVASHDLQEPLRTITSYLTLLQRRYQGKLGADADEFIGFATDGAQRMSALIKAVLAYSRVGTHGAAFGPTDCGALVAAAVANLEARIVESDARVVYDALPAVHGDAAQLGQLFQNLIGNALKFTRPDVAPLVRVEAERQGERWLVRVTDNGIGIAPT